MLDIYSNPDLKSQLVSVSNPLRLNTDSTASAFFSLSQNIQIIQTTSNPLYVIQYMNSNTHHQRSDNTFFYTPITSAFLSSIMNQINSLQNPTTEDFEGIIQQFQQYFFHFIEQQRFYPRSST